MELTNEDSNREANHRDNNRQRKTQMGIPVHGGSTVRQGLVLSLLAAFRLDLLLLLYDWLRQFGCAARNQCFFLLCQAQPCLRQVKQDNSLLTDRGARDL
jgi:hypothetical protein